MLLPKIDVLLAEDNLNDAELTMRTLRKITQAGQIVHVNDGEEALNFIFCKGEYQHRAFDQTPKLIVLDLKMPKVDGMEVLKMLKADARTRGIPVVFLTSSKEEKDIAASYESGVNSYLVKPVEYADFVEAVSELGKYWLSLNQPPSIDLNT